MSDEKGKVLEFKRTARQECAIYRQMLGRIACAFNSTAPWSTEAAQALAEINSELEAQGLEPIDPLKPYGGLGGAA